MRNRKRKQKETFSKNDYKENPVPIWRSSAKRANEQSAAGPSNKRLSKEERVLRDERLKQALDKEMVDRLTKKIHDVLIDNDDTGTLKTDCLKMSKIERGTVSNAEEKNGLPVGSITTFIRNNKKSNISFWHDVVNKHFDDLVRKEMDEKTKSDISLHFNDAEEIESNTSSMSKNQSSESDVTRTISSPLLPLLRKDLTQDMKNWIIKIIDVNIEKTTDYLSDLSIRVYKLLLLFTQYSFKLNDDESFELKKTHGLKMKEIIPSFSQSGDAFFSPPWNQGCLQNDVFQKQLQELFSFSHLQFIHSCYFGVHGVTNESLDKNPLRKAIFQVIPRIKEEVKSDTDASAMQNALFGYNVNLSNMWSEPKRYYKLLNKLLQVLLNVHLAPTRHQKYKEYLDAKSKANDERTSSSPMKFANKTRNSKRRIFQNERKRENTYEEKARKQPHVREKWMRRAQKSRERLALYEQTLRRERDLLAQKSDQLPDSQSTSEDDLAIATEVEELENEFEDTSTDLPRRRLNALQRTLRALLLKGEHRSVTGEQLTTMNEGLKDNEATVLAMLYNFITPYIPKKSNRGSFSYQIPFLLMCNQVFRATNSYKFVTKLCPLIKPGSLCALKLDAATLYSLFCSRTAKQQISVFDHENIQIPSMQMAIRRKDAMFGSFFDLQQIFTILDMHNLRFDHYMIVLPGVKLLRLIGHKKTYPPQNTCMENEVEVKKPVADETENDYQDSNVLLEDANETLLLQELKMATKERNEFIVQQKLRSLKKDWHDHEDKNKVYQSINEYKSERDKLYKRVFQASKDLKNLRRQKYQSQTIDNSEKKWLITKENYKCYQKAEDVKITDEVLTDSLHLSGTDNGIVTMSETCAFNLERFAFHLKLYNKYSALADLSIAEEDKKFISIPQTIKLTSSRVQYQSGGLRARHLLNRKKKKDKAILEVEKNLSKSSLTGAENPKHLDELYEVHLANREKLRDFYYSNAMIKAKRRSELLLNRTKDRVAALERKFVAGKCNPIMFVGDRGYGIGSTIKGHVKYGGSWKAQVHQRYTSVVITNEHNTSQTCLFCFQKLQHPLKVIIKNEKRYVRLVNGTFVCNNSLCPLKQLNSTHKGRDAVSALAIGISGAATTMLEYPLPVFDPQRDTSQFNTGKFNISADEFLKRIASRPATVGGITSRHMDE